MQKPFVAATLRCCSSLKLCFVEHIGAVPDQFRGFNLPAPTSDLPSHKLAHVVVLNDKKTGTSKREAGDRLKSHADVEVPDRAEAFYLLTNLKFGGA